METVDYIYRYDPKNPSVKAPPYDPEQAKHALEDGNRIFSRWMNTCGTGTEARGVQDYVIKCNGLTAPQAPKPGVMPKQAPFAVVVGCSDARVPVEMLFGQGFNELFVVRVAGNVMGDVCMGSIDFALTALIHSVKVVVMLGHSGCGAVAATVDSYLEPTKFWSKSTSHMLRTIQEKIFVAVREADNGLREIWGPQASAEPNYRAALIESAIALNAAHSAYDLRQEIDRDGKREVGVLFGVFNLLNHQVSMPVIPNAPVSDKNVSLRHAPAKPQEFHTLAKQMAEILKGQ